MSCVLREADCTMKNLNRLVDGESGLHRFDYCPVRHTTVAQWDLHHYQRTYFDDRL